MTCTLTLELELDGTDLNLNVLLDGESQGTETVDLGGLQCTFTASNGETATPSGVFYDACSRLPLPASGEPEDSNPAAGYPTAWRQIFTDDNTGDEGYWIVQADTNGVHQWHQIT